MDKDDFLRAMFGQSAQKPKLSPAEEEARRGYEVAQKAIPILQAVSGVDGAPRLAAAGYEECSTLMLEAAEHFASAGRIARQGVQGAGEGEEKELDKRDGGA